MPATYYRNPHGWGAYDEMSPDERKQLRDDLERDNAYKDRSAFEDYAESLERKGKRDEKPERD